MRERERLLALTNSQHDTLEREKERETLTRTDASFEVLLEFFW